MIFACCTLAMSAQVTIPVKYQGAKPTISDFASSFLSYRDALDDEDCVDESTNAFRYAWEQHRKGLPQEEGVTLTVDDKNGYILYTYKYEEDSVKDELRIEMCYWNESDGKHKLIAYNVAYFRNGESNPGQFDGLTFYRYNNATKKMTMWDDVGFEVKFGTEEGNGFAYITHALPRTGKDIVITTWYKAGKQVKTLKWNGRRFVK